MSTLAVSQNEKNIPRPIVDKLHSVVRRARSVMFVRGLLIVCAAALIALLLGMAIDSTILIFSSAIRLTISLTLLGGVLIVAWLFLVRPLMRSFDLTGIARIIEQRHPELEERISSSVELLTSNDASEIRGSQALINELAKQAVGQVSSVSPQKEFSFAAARPALIVAGIAAAILLALFLIWPSAAGRLLNRVVAPLANIGNVQAADIVVTPGDVVVVSGESLLIEVEVTDPRVRSARIRTRDVKSTTGVTAEVATRLKRVESEGDNPRFILSMPVVKKSFEYRVHAGGALTQYYTATVVDRPEIEQFEVTYQFPEYLSRDNYLITDATPNIRAPIGTVVTIVAKTKNPIASAKLQIDGLEAIKGKPVEAEKSSGGNSKAETGNKFSWQVELTDKFIIGRSWQVSLKDEHGFENDPTSQTIVSLPDKPPTITIVEPAILLQRRSIDDTLPLQYRVEEDFGVARVELITSVDGGDEQSKSLAIPTRRNTGLLDVNASFNSLTKLTLSKMAGSDAKEIRVYLRVSDFFPAEKGGPQQAISDTLTIVLDENAESYFKETAAADYAGIRDALQRVLADLQQADDRTSVLTNDVKIEGALSDKSVARIDEVQQLTSDASVELAQLADILPTTTFAPLQFEVESLKRTDVSSAREQAGLIKLADSPLERGLYADASDKHAERTVERTEQLIKDLDELWAQVQEIADLRQLAARQDRIADEIAATTEQELPKLPELPVAKNQAEITAEVAELLKVAPEALEDLLNDQEQEAEDLVETAERLADEQMKLADLTRKTNLPKADLENLRDEIAEQVARQQEEVSAEVAKLDEDIEAAQRAGTDDESDLSEEPQQAADDLKKNDFAAAAENANKAAENLQQAADALENNNDVPDEKASDQANENANADSEDQQSNANQKNDDAAATNEGQEDSKQDGAKQDGAKQDGAKQDGAKQDGAKQDGAKQDEADKNAAEENGSDENTGTKRAENGEQAGSEEPAGQESEKGEAGENEAAENSDDANADNSDDAQPEQGTPKPQDAALAERAAELAEKQSDIAEQIEALNEGNLDKALELLQEQSEEQIADLAQQAEQIADVLELVSPMAQASKSTERAMEQLEIAEQRAEEASGQLADAAEQTDQAIEASDAAEAAQGEQGEAAQGEQGEAAQGEQGEAAQGEQGEAAQGEQGEAAQGEQGEAAQGEQGEASEAGEAMAAERSDAKNNASLNQRKAAQALKQAANNLKQAARAANVEAQRINPEKIAALTTADMISAELSDAVEASSEASSSLEDAAEAGQAAASQADSQSGEAQAAQSEASASQAAAAQSARDAAEALASAADKVAQEAGLMNESTPQTGSQASGEEGEEGEDGQSQGKDSSESGESGENENSESNKPSQSEGDGDGKLGRIGGTMDNELQEKLDDMGITAVQWTRLPGSLKNRIRQSESEGVPEEYRSMVRRYFREIARRSNEDSKKSGTK